MTTPDNQRDVIVVGAGISGLTTAWHLHHGNADVLLLEQQPQVGGAMQTEQRDGFLLEKGPFNVIVRDPSFEELLEGLKDRIQVVSAADDANNRYLYRHQQIMTVPTGLIPLMKSPLLSTRGKLRAARGLFISSRGNGGECTIEEFATRRFGREVSDTMVSAVVAGIMAGDIRKLSAYACFPVLRRLRSEVHQPARPHLQAHPDHDPQALQPGSSSAAGKALSASTRASADSLLPSPPTSTAVYTRRPRLLRHRTARQTAITWSATRDPASRSTTPGTSSSRRPAKTTATLLQPHVPSAADEILHEHRQRLARRV
jgi:hypothetical protein